MKNIVKRLLVTLGLARPYKIQTFTYYIPSPPHRKTGYREKQFDKVFFEFINRGYKIVSTQTQASTGQDSSGMWIIFTVQALTEEANSLDLDSFFNDQISSDINEIAQEDTVEGLYQINS